MTTVWCGLCRSDHIPKMCELCGADSAHGHKLIHLCEPCKSILRESRNGAHSNEIQRKEVEINQHD